MASITLTNLANYSLGIANDETAINVQKVSNKASGAKIMVKDKIGHEIGRVDHEIHQEYSIEGFVSGTTGIFADQIGVDYHRGECRNTRRYLRWCGHPR